MEQVKITSLKTLTVIRSNVYSQLLWILLFAALTVVGAKIEIQNQPVPFTLQTFFVLLSGAMLGARNGAISQTIYLLLGAIGVPVFSGFGFGVARLLGPTGGYLLSFPIAAFTIGYLVRQNKSIIWTFVSMAVGLFIIFSFGTIYLNVFYLHNWRESFTYGFLIFSWWDGLKLIAASAIYNKISKRIG